MQVGDEGRRGRTGVIDEHAGQMKQQQSVEMMTVMAGNVKTAERA